MMNAEAGGVRGIARGRMRGLLVCLSLLSAGYASAEWVSGEPITGNAPGMGRSSAIAVDPSGDIHISCIDTADGTLRYFKRTGTTWTSVVVDTVGASMWQTAIALDASGNPHISYYDTTGLRYAHWSGAAWSTAAVDAVGYGGPDSVGTDIAVDSSGKPYISYFGYAAGDLKYARWTGTEWSTQTVDSEGNVGQHNSIALDASGRPRISYLDSTNGRLKYAEWTGTVWSTQTVDASASVGTGNSLVLDASGLPRISYLDTTNSKVKYAAWNGAAWGIETIAYSDSEPAIFGTSLGLDPWGKPKIAFASNGGGYPGLRCFEWTGSGWTIDSVGPTWVHLTNAPAIAVDSLGSAHFSYDESLNPSTRLLWYAEWVPGSCVQVVVKKDGSADALTIQGALDSLPKNLGADACIVIRDAQTYAEAVTVEGFANNGHRIRIFGDPSFVSSAPVVTPPGGSFAAFDIRQASVTLANMKILSPDYEMYGVRAASPSVVLSSMVVRIAENLTWHLGDIIASGVLLSSGSEISASDVYANFMAPIRLSGVGSVVSGSTATRRGGHEVAVQLSETNGGVVSDVKIDGYLLVENGLDSRILRSSATRVQVDYSSATRFQDIYVGGYFVGIWVRYSTGTVIEDSVITSTMAVLFESGNVGFSMHSSRLVGGVGGSFPRVRFDQFNSGEVDISSCVIQPVVQGIQVATQSAGFHLQLSSITFTAPYVAGATAIRLLGGTIVSTFSFINFSDVGIAINIDLSTPTPGIASLNEGSRITMVNSTGPRSGELYEADPLGFVDWGDYSPQPAGFSDVGARRLRVVWVSSFPVGTLFYAQLSTASDFSGILVTSNTYSSEATFLGLTSNTTYYARVSYAESGPFTSLGSTWTPRLALPAGCGSGATVAKSGFGDYTTIQGALDALEKNMGADTCVVVGDTQTYSESVVVQGFTNNGYRLKIMADPAFTSSAPVVTPPGGSFAAFDIRQASVTLANIKILSPDYELYGVRAASPSVVLSSMVVRIAENRLSHSGERIASGVLLSSASGLSSSDVYAKFMDAVTLTGTDSSISGSTAASSSLDFGVHVRGGRGHVLSDSRLGSVQYDDAALGIQLLRSTVTGGVTIAYSSGAFLKDLYISRDSSAWPAVWIVHSTGTRIEDSSIQALMAVSLSSGNVGLALRGSHLLGNAPGELGPRLELGSATPEFGLYGRNTGTVEISSCIIAPATLGISVSTSVPGLTLAFSSITFAAPSLAGATAIRFLAGSFVSTFSGVSFSDVGISTNVDASLLDGLSRLTMKSAVGPRAGPIYEKDPLGVVDWSEYAISALSYVGVTSGSVTARWTTSFPDGTLYYAQLSSSPDFSGVLASSNTYGSAATFEGLAPQMSYYGRVSYASGGPYTLLGAVATSVAPPGAPGAPEPLVQGTSSISWTWSLLPAATGYDVFQSSSGLLLGSVAAPPYVQQGLLPNATYALVLRGRNAGGTGPLSPAATGWTLAAVPSGFAADVFIASAALRWGLNGNPSGTLASLERSTDSTAYAARLNGAATFYLDAGLSACTTYQYRVRFSNWGGVPTSHAALQFVTAGSTPLAPGSLTAESLSGRLIRLAWEPAPSGDALDYRLYWDNGTGTVDYGAPLAVLSSTVTSWTTAALTEGTVYRFGLRAYNRCGVEESNTRVLAQATAIGSLTGVKAAIKVPQSGKRIKGNRVTVMAELTLGEEAQTRQVRFQYRAAGGGAWLDIPAADANHPNPDGDAPYFMHWDVTGLGTGDYELRAAAKDVYDVIDAAPAVITVTVTNDPVEFDISETSLGGGKVKKEQVVYQAVANTVQAADGGTAQTAKVLIPAQALSASTVAVAVTNNPPTLPALPLGVESAGASVEITLSNGQSQLSGGQTATVTLSYKDDNDDGIVDGTVCRADRLEIYAHDAATGQWRKEGASTVDSAAKTVSAPTPHFSFFAVVAPTSADLSALHIYPSPYRPNNAESDDGVPYAPGNPDSGIVFENLPDRARIRIFTVTGKLVAHFEAGTAGKVQWDASSDDGRQVATGVYLAVVGAPGQKEVVRKIAIIR